MVREDYYDIFLCHILLYYFIYNTNTYDQNDFIYIYLYIIRNSQSNPHSFILKFLFNI